MFAWDFQSVEVPFAKHGPNPYTVNGEFTSDNNGRCVVTTNKYMQDGMPMTFHTDEMTEDFQATIKPRPASDMDTWTGLEARSTKTQARLSYTCFYDDSFDASVLTVKVGNTGETKEVTRSGSGGSTAHYVFTLENLKPLTEYSLAFYFGGKDMGITRNFKTKGVGASISKKNADATTFVGRCSYIDDDDEVEEEYVMYNNEKYPVTKGTVTVTGLDPESKASFTYYVKLKGYNISYSPLNITMSKLDLKTLAPKVVSKSTVVVSAESNLNDLETHAGLEWRKIDAPDEVPSKRAFITPIGGKMEGRIENLEASTYYKVRAFYENAAGTKQWYGEWIDFDPSDFSYFEPTVNTMEASAVEATTADVKGYAFAGSDDITEQGFEYWPEREIVAVASAHGMKAPQVSQVIGTVSADGRIMTATLENLKPETTYYYRAFVRTASGATQYGEEKTFTTAKGEVGVDEIETEDTVVTVEGYYDLNGYRHASPVSGLNIVRYSNGSARKIFVK